MKATTLLVIAAVAIAVGGALFLVASLPEIRRYLKMRSM